MVYQLDVRYRCRGPRKSDYLVRRDVALGVMIPHITEFAKPLWEHG